MYTKREIAVDALMTQAKEMASLMGRDETAQFFSELADRAYAQYENLSINDEYGLRRIEINFNQ